ncbi:serine/threonine protein kinase, bacterial [Fibrella aestuarina BUZ 2]|uniref:Serine/threonine protein kinase, bacterial n=1 Tax=Fibrella aestuarina BUZ 2 TaxID=1166018 RepID=I0K969_9BACT|nr:serine/threonine-protein kinase [Fibrella aestuarina]CCH00672.1 serine/threonine protein kinase, bacterial [Fibrella aestuarina BUZ 2]
MTPHIDTFADFKRRYPIRPADPATWLGSGSYGRVVKVEDQVETEWVAIKISEFKGEDSQSLRAEVELAQRIPRHTNIARYDRCYRFETDASVSDFAVMKYYRDGNLANLLKHQKLTATEVYDLTKGILLGLQHLHRQRIVHRDFKPANILISRDNQGRLVPKIADFGLSKLVNGEAALDQSDFDLSDGRGTPSYKAPEQIEGGRVSYNLDLWAFGVVLYEMLVGEKPFGADRPADSEQRARRTVEQKIMAARLPAKVEQVAEPYRTIIKRCLVRDLYQRVRRADELLALLDGVANEQPSESVPVPGNVPERAPDEPTDLFKEEQTDLFGQTEPTDLRTELAVEPTEHIADTAAIPPRANVPEAKPTQRQGRRNTWRMALPAALLLAGLGIYLYVARNRSLATPNQKATNGSNLVDTRSGGANEPIALLTTMASASTAASSPNTVVDQLLQQARTAFYREQYPQAVLLADKGLHEAPQRQELIRLKSLALERLAARPTATAPARPTPATAATANSQAPALDSHETLLAAQQAQRNYDQLIERGTSAITNGNRKAEAITAFSEARALADKYKLNTERGHERYMFYMEKGDRIFDRDEREGALLWYQVAQSIENTAELKARIKKCSQLQ